MKTSTEIRRENLNILIERYGSIANLNAQLGRNRDNARIYVTVQNPFILTKFRGLDPEQPDLTNIGDTDGMTMNALLGVNISF